MVLLIADDLHVPVDILLHQALEVAEILSILEDKVNVTVLPLLWVVHTTLVLVDPFIQGVRQSHLEVLLDAKLRDVDRLCRVELRLDLVQVRQCIVEVGGEASLVDDIAELALRVGEVVDVGHHVLVVLLQKHGVLAETDN